MKKCSTGTNCYIGNKKVPREQKNKIYSAGLNLIVGMKKMFHWNKLFHWNKKVPLEQKLKFIQLGTILPLEFKKFTGTNYSIGTNEKKCSGGNRKGKKKKNSKARPQSPVGREKTKTKWAARATWSICAEFR